MPVSGPGLRPRLVVHEWGPERCQERFGSWTSVLNEGSEMVQQAVAHETIARGLMLSFTNWASKDLKYKRVFSAIDKTPAMDIVQCGLSEIDALKPGYFDLWWAKNHMRFQKVRQVDARKVHELMYVFLTKLARKELTIAKKVTRKEKPRQKTAGQRQG